MEQKNEQNQESPQQTQGNRGYQPIDESKINWQELEEKWGVRRDDLEKSGDLTKMLNYGKSDLVRVSPNFGGEAFELDARLSFKKDSEGNVSLVPHFIRKEQKLDEYKEHKFSDEDRKNLRETGNLGRVVDIVDGKRARSSLVHQHRPQDERDYRHPGKQGAHTGAHRQDGNHQAGAGHAPRRAARARQTYRAQGRQEVRHHPAGERGAARRGVRAGNRQVAPCRQTQETKNNPAQGQAQDAENAAATQNEQRRNSWTNADGSIRPISKWSGVDFTEQQKADYVAGKAVKLENVTDKQGFHATMYIKFNPEKDARTATTPTPTTLRRSPRPTRAARRWR